MVLSSRWRSWRLPHLTVRYLNDYRFTSPSEQSADVTILPERDETGTKGFYKPIIFPNEFWQLRSQFIEINTTTPTLPLQVTFQPMSYWKFTILASLTASFAEAAKQQGSAGSAEMDEIKRMLVETNPWFLGLTAFVSILHVMWVLTLCCPVSISELLV